MKLPYNSAELSNINIVIYCDAICCPLSTLSPCTPLLYAFKCGTERADHDLIVSLYVLAYYQPKRDPWSWPTKWNFLFVSLF